MVHLSLSWFPTLTLMHSWLADKFPSQHVRWLCFSFHCHHLCLGPSLSHCALSKAFSLCWEVPSCVKSSPAPPDPVRPQLPLGSHPILVHSPMTLTVPYFVTAQTSASPVDCRLPPGAILFILCPRWLIQYLVHSRYPRDIWLTNGECSIATAFKSNSL